MIEEWKEGRREQGGKKGEKKYEKGEKEKAKRVRYYNIYTYVCVYEDYSKPLHCCSLFQALMGMSSNRTPSIYICPLNLRTFGRKYS